ncbi:MAG TPA: hypothetical protein DCQ31_00865 [Bacteroidales bacterium]|nr:hypothetical protein [Bacteroidales bacterium]
MNVKLSNLHAPNPYFANLEAHSDHRFIETGKNRIIEALAQNNFELKIGSISDILALKKFINLNCRKLTAEQLTEAYLFSSIQYGELVLIYYNKVIVAFHLTCYHFVPHKISAVIYVAVNSMHRGYKLGVLSSYYSSLLAFEKGCEFKNTWIAPDNYPSLVNHINYEGFSGIDFKPSMFLPGQGRIVVSFKLTRLNLLYNRIDMGKLKEFIANPNIEGEFKIINPENENELLEFISSQQFKISACIPTETGNINFLLTK